MKTLWITPEQAKAIPNLLGRIAFAELAYNGEYRFSYKGESVRFLNPRFLGAKK